MEQQVSFLPTLHCHAPHSDNHPDAVPGLISSLCTHTGKHRGTLTATGRAAIRTLLKKLSLKRDDEVWITTTYDLPNVSSCVTCTVFNVCKPSRVLTDHTRLIFVIHEFGVPHPDTPRLRELASERGIPLLEDCAHTIDSRRDGWQVGSLGDYVLVSFPKLFPCLSGGVLLGGDISYEPASFEASGLDRAARIAAFAWNRWPAQAERRRKVFRELAARFAEIGLFPLYERIEGITPWFFPVRTPYWHEMMDAARARRVDCGVWHGSDVVVFPCHQFLDDSDLDQIVHVAVDVIMSPRK